MKTPRWLPQIFYLYMIRFKLQMNTVEAESAFINSSQLPILKKRKYRNLMDPVPFRFVTHPI